MRPSVHESDVVALPSGSTSYVDVAAPRIAAGPYELTLPASVRAKDAAQVLIEVELDEALLPFIAAGAVGSVQFGSDPARLPATVVSVDKTASSRTAELRLPLAGHATKLRAGDRGRAWIRVAAAGALVPPEAVLFDGGSQPVVYVASGDRTYRRRRVVAADPVSGQVPIVSGLDAGDRVVVRDALLLDRVAEVRF